MVPNKGVKTTHPDYERLLPYWTDCRNAASGQRAMHKAGQLYIDKLVDETDDAYRGRIKRSNFFNGTWRTIAGLKGMAFRVDPTAELPAAMVAMADDITLSGVDLNAFASNIVEEVLEVGRVGIMVDFPQTPPNVVPLTVAASESMGLRPTVQFYQAESIRNWRFKRVANAWVLAMVTLAEMHQTGEDEFGHEGEQRYRVLDLDEAGFYRQRVFTSKEGKDELIEGPFYPMMNNAPMRFVPFITVGAAGKGDATDEPPLIDLVDANVALYQVNSDRRHGLHFTGLPTLFLAGMQQEPGQIFHIGSTAAICSPDPNAKGSYIEFTGQGLGPSREMSLEIKQEMAMLGARMLADETRNGAETLGGTQIKHQGENSMLGEIIGHVSAALEWALGVFAQWAGQAGKVVYQINRQFLPVPMGPQELTALVAAWQSGAVSESELFTKLQQGEVIDSAKSFDEHQAEVEISTPAPVKPAVPANDGQQAA